MKENCITKMYLSKRNPIFFGCQKRSEQERGIFPSLPDTSTFGVNSPQMAQKRAKKTLNDPKSKKRRPGPIVEKN